MTRWDQVCREGTCLACQEAWAELPPSGHQRLQARPGFSEPEAETGRGVLKYGVRNAEWVWSAKSLNHTSNAPKLISFQLEERKEAG